MRDALRDAVEADGELGLGGDERQREVGRGELVELAGLGELHKPSVADIFVATMKNGGTVQ